ncbi:uncharacterized protein LOC108600416 [Drosophila busckii]|uniref:uncharacterized protein LOC108600416 n=1 Tax=Drosophila busckii TaxID=30019 RepID=UPI00083EA4A4|nr:uncharacterized protein LOC108600416 [Drosophila busckii]
MLRIIPNLKYWPCVPKLKSFLAQQRTCSNGKMATTLVDKPAEVAVPDFAQQLQPKSIVELREDLFYNSATKWTTREYLQGKLEGSAVLEPEEVNQHRLAVMQHLSNQQRNRCYSHILVLLGADATAERLPFRQHSDLLYLCDCLMPGVVLVLLRNRKRELCSLLFEPGEEQDYDERLAKHACKRYNVDEVLPMARLRGTLIKLLNHSSSKLWHKKESTALSQLVSEVAEELNLILNCPSNALQYTRSLKTPKEMEAMRLSSSIAAQSLQELLEDKQEHNGSQLAALYAYKCQQRSHYQPLPFEPKVFRSFGGTWLMGVSSQHAGYCSCLARSWPQRGQFSNSQQLIYSLLFDLRTQLCRMICGNASGTGCTPLELQSKYIELLAGKLWQLRVLSPMVGTRAQNLEIASQFSAFSTLITHAGLDLAPCSQHLMQCPLMPGNVFYLQMSVCIPNDCRHVYPEFRGVLCTLGDCWHITEQFELELLTSDCSSNRRDVEQFRSYNNSDVKRVAQSVN